MNENDGAMEILGGSIIGDTEYELDIIYHNMNATSNFRTVRAFRHRTVEDQLQRFACQIGAGCFDAVVSVAASKGSFVVVMQTSLSDKELTARGFLDGLRQTMVLSSREKRAE